MTVKSIMTIRLDGMDEVDPDSDLEGWWVDDEVIYVRTDTSLNRYKLPKGCRRIRLGRLGEGRSELALGGYTTTTVRVIGPTETLKSLREAVL